MRLIKEIRLKAEVLHMAHSERLSRIRLSFKSIGEYFRGVTEASKPLRTAENEYNELQAKSEPSRPFCHCERAQRQRE